MNSDDAGVRVTLATIYDKLLHVESVIAPIPDHVSDHEIRIRAIEKYLWIWIGASGVLGAGAGQIINFFINR